MYRIPKPAIIETRDDKPTKKYRGREQKQAPSLSRLSVQAVFCTTYPPIYE